MTNCRCGLYLLLLCYIITNAFASQNEPCEGMLNLANRFDVLEQEVKQLRNENNDFKTKLKAFGTKKSTNADDVINFGEDHKRYPLNANEGGIAFSVSLSSAGLTNLGVNQTIHFDKVISNLGNAFDTIMSFFKAPVAGWYAFSVTMMARPRETQFLYVLKNGHMMFHVYSSGTDYATDSRTMVFHLNVGDEVWVQTTENPGYSSIVHGGEHTSFTEFLLYVD